ncbi:uncharacterized protein LOC126266957 isoform X1 [Schistocerca gregaria]|uniref:uncharacterized protein LOC126266957 isoform X1 n=2 Tax=Schistocerca gregaria TaxID=7010 RepID=UPI00211ECEA9|nr:uncharacterized protein LOC126266957 isoform X1 [Schistocerca gregaria]
MEVTPCNLEDMFAVRESQYTCTVASRRAPSRGAIAVPRPARHPSQPSFLCRPAPPSTPSTSSSSLSPSSSSPSSSSSSTASLAIRRLCRALVVSACVLIVARVPAAMSAPTGSARLSELKQSPARWLTPCGDAQPDPSPGDLADQGDAADAGASGPLGHLQLQVGIASDNAASFLKSFVSTEKSKEVFHGNSDIESEFKDKKYPWLPELPNMDECLPSDHFNGLEKGEALRRAFTNIQRFAVGLEQIVWDRKDKGDVLAEQFAKAEDELRLVLCELVTVMQQLSVELPESVSRDIMEDAVRLETGDARDWIIYRDYVNALKYTNAVINYFANPSSYPACGGSA